MRATILRRCLVFAVAAGLIARGRGDEQSSLEGFVTTDITAAVPGARIGIDSLSKGFHQETMTNVTGYYTVENLNPGAYSVWAEVRGLGCIVYPRVVLLPGKRVRQDFRFVRTGRYPGGCNVLK